MKKLPVIKKSMELFVLVLDFDILLTSRIFKYLDKLLSFKI